MKEREILTDNPENLPEIYDCCMGMLVVVLFLNGWIAAGGGYLSESNLLSLIGFVLSLGFICVIVILYRIEKHWRNIAKRERPLGVTQDE